MPVNPNDYVSATLQHLLRYAMATVGKNPRSLPFYMGLKNRLKAEYAVRQNALARGLLVPPVLVLDAGGRYSGGTAFPAQALPPLLAGAGGLGTSAIVLAGEKAAQNTQLLELAKGSQLLFAVFCTPQLAVQNLPLFSTHRGLVPLVLTNGEADAACFAAMRRLHSKGIPYGALGIVTSNTLAKYTTPLFAQRLAASGCPACLIMAGEEGMQNLSPALEPARRAAPQTLLLAYPGDEEMLGTWFAPGKGYLYIDGLQQVHMQLWQAGEGFAKAADFEVVCKQAFQTLCI